MDVTTKLKGRYETREILGEGGMGVVYRAFDLEVPREVAVKTIRESTSPQELELFRKECGVLAMLHHPNIVDLYDYGDYPDGSHVKPFFVMPLLPGMTLDKLIRNSAGRLTVQRVLDIITQTCRGLQAAHEKGLVHRDIKPSNIFVLDDDSVKLIDFGVVHVTDNRSKSGIKGTLAYMSPEQVEMSPPTALSDIFSLAVVCYEALTRRRPFTGTTDDEIVRAILHHTPPPVSDLNPAVNFALAQVIHAAMAKKPWHRTSSARQFAEELQKALHGQPIERFDAARIEPRIRRAQKAMEESEYEFAAEILSELEAEGHFHPEIRSLRRQNDQALRARTVAKLLESARRRFEQEEYPFALQKIEELLRLDAGNQEAIALKSDIEGKHKTRQIENWFRLAEEHIKNFAYDHAREALQNVLKLKPTSTLAIQMLSEVDRREHEYLEQKKEKEELYNVALNCWHRGEVSSALSKLQRVIELDRRAPDLGTSDSAPPYQNLYKEVRSEHDAINNAYAEARKLLSEDDFAGADGICETYLRKYPGHALFQALKFDIGELQRQHVSAYIAKVDRDVDAEPDLDRRMAILSEAVTRYPDESHFQRALKVVTDRRELVNSIIQKVHNLEERGQFNEALGQMEILRTVYPQYPGLNFEIERVLKRREQQVVFESRARYVDQVDRAIQTRDFTHALKLLGTALAEFPGDSELMTQGNFVREALQRAAEAVVKLQEGQELFAKGEIESGLDCLWQAHRLDESNPVIRAVLIEALLKRASAELERDWAISEQLVRQALELEPANAAARSLQKMVTDRQRELIIDERLSNSRKLQSEGDLKGALEEVEKGLALYPDEARLRTRKESLQSSEEFKRPLEKRKDLEEIEELRVRMKAAADDAARISILERTRAIARKHPEDRQVQYALKQAEAWQATVLLRGEKIPEFPAESAVPEADAMMAESLPRQPRIPRLPLETDGEDAVVAGPASVSREPDDTLGPKRWTAKRVSLLVSFLVALVAGVLFLSRRPPAPPPEGPFEVAVQVRTPVSGAQIRVNGEEKGTTPLNLALREGEYKIEARLRGYRPSEPVTLVVARDKGAPPPIDLQLEPLPPIIRLFSELQQAFLDDKGINLQNGGYETSVLEAGHHTLRMNSPLFGIVKVEFEITPGHLPTILDVSKNEIGVIALASLADQGQIYSNIPLKLGMNGQPAQEVGQQGLRITLVEGSNELQLEDSKTSKRETVFVDPNPVLTILVGSQPEAGNLRVEANVEDAMVSIEPADGREPRKQAAIKSGTAMFPRLLPKAYRVQIAANGYRNDERSVLVQKGQVTRVLFSLDAAKSTLAIRGGTPGAQVLLDGVFVGEVDRNGNFNWTVLPGTHRVVLQLREHEPVSFERNFPANETILLPEQQVRLRPFGWIEFNVNPRNAEVTYRLSNEQEAHVTRSVEKVPLKAGSYSVTVRADNFQTRIEDVAVNAGQGLKIDWVLAASVVTNVDSPRSDVKPVMWEGFGNVFTVQDDWHTVKTDFALFKDKAPGKYFFNIRLKGGLLAKKRGTWIVNFVDSKNYIEYEIDETNITRTVISSGKRITGKPQPHNFGRPPNDVYTVYVVLEANKLAISGMISGSNNSYTAFGDTSQEARNFLEGRFGFPKDQSIGQFRFETISGK